jgi:hypothetical protein
MARVFGKDDLKEAGPIMQLLEIVNRVIAYRTAHARDAAHTSLVSDVLALVLTKTRSSCSYPRHAYASVENASTSWALRAEMSS